MSSKQNINKIKIISNDKIYDMGSNGISSDKIHDNKYNVSISGYDFIGLKNFHDFIDDLELTNNEIQVILELENNQDITIAKGYGVGSYNINVNDNSFSLSFELVGY